MLYFCQEIQEAFAKKKEVSTKSTYADLVTETDTKVENMVIGFLRKKFPNHRFLVYALNSDKISVANSNTTITILWPLYRLVNITQQALLVKSWRIF